MTIQRINTFLDSPLGLGVLLVFLAGIEIPLYLFLRRKESPYKSQILILVSLVYLSLVFLLLSFAFPVKGKVSAGVTPRLWILGILLCSLYLAIRINKGKEKSDPSVSSSQSRMVFLYILLCLGYLGAIDLLGFFPASFFFLLIGMRLLSYTHPVGLIVLSLGWIAFLYLVFYSLLSVPFPEGILIPYLLG
ncbi:MAG: tripartite tricarboxylate transporter TctB family protein [Spirochaetes bacterium]|nr:tripartite tricarboxylate transporter TctB family protein [Spirochaetota bacterium]